MKSVVKYLILAGIAVAAILVVYTKVFVPKHTFKTLHYTSGQLTVQVQGIGNVNALNMYSITAQTGGKILEILTDEGEWVKKGDLLIVMDGVDLPAQLEMARASLEKALQEERALKEELNSQKAQKRLLQVTFARYAKLFEQKFVARAEYDKVEADLRSIEATIAATRSRIESSVAAVRIARKNVEAVQEKVDRLEIHAPADGYVVAREAEVAQYVAPSSPILKMVDPETLWVETRIDERISSGVKPGQKASIMLRSQPGKRYRGIVRRVDAMTDPVTLERTVNVGFDILPRPFYINEQARVVIDVRHLDNVVKIPLTAVVQKNGKTGIWVLSGKRAHFVPLRRIAVGQTEMAVEDPGTDSPIIVSDSRKKSLREGMRIFL